MIKHIGNVFHINTKNTSYIFCITKIGDLQHLYYGERIEFQTDYSALLHNKSLFTVCTLYPENDYTYSMDGTLFEYSYCGCGDMRETALDATCGNDICSFKYKDYLQRSSVWDKCPLPLAHESDEELTIEAYDKITDSSLYFRFAVFFESDCITRSVALKAGEKNIKIKKLLSLQLDFERQDLKYITFNGAWGRERFKQECEIINGKVVNESLSGASSAKHNPFVMVAQKNADEFSCDTFGFNLIYSGNHYESIEATSFGNTRFLSGINSSSFTYDLKANEFFYAPEAVMTFSKHGYNGVSNNMHCFINKHIIPKYWQSHDKPIMLNSWEAMYFDINEDKIFALAERAEQIGIELLVVDDGWFGERNDDTSSLGDWFANKNKFSKGIRFVSDTLHKKGLKFGLWFEPEMVSKKSELFKKHPDWVLGNMNKKPLIIGRNQFVLDLSNPQVQDYIIDFLDKNINEAKIDYIKWDFNRMISDFSSTVTNLGEVYYRYILGLYRVLSVITSKYPAVLFELCASGGARFDLGMLSFMPFGWTSDNTDVLSRALIQEGTSYGYPPNVMCNHISICPNHQTKRNTSIMSRYSIAFFGVLGLQYNLLLCNDETLKELTEIIRYYKEIRTNLKNAVFYRLMDGFESNYSSWLLVSENKKNAYLMVFQKTFYTVSALPIIKMTGLINDAEYEISNLKIKAKGEILMKHGLLLPQNYQGFETTNDMSDFLDYTAKIYSLKVVDK